MNWQEWLFLIGALFVMLLGGHFARMDGGAKPSVPEIVERVLCLSPFAACLIPYAGWWSILAFIGIVGVATGHGQYFLRRMLKACTPEKVDFIVRWFFGKDWRCQFPKDYPFSGTEAAHYQYVIRPQLYWRCVTGLFVTGLLVGLPAACIALSFRHWVPATILLCTGFIKSFSYMIGEWLYEKNLMIGVPYIGAGTEIAEFINGFCRTGLCIAALAWVLFA